MSFLRENIGQNVPIMASMRKSCVIYAMRVYLFCTLIQPTTMHNAYVPIHRSCQIAYCFFWQSEDAFSVIPYSAVCIHDLNDKVLPDLLFFTFQLVSLLLQG